VAVRLTARTRARTARQIGPDRPVPAAAPDPADGAAWLDLVAALDAKLAELPDALRAALVTCYYEGLTQDEAARQLGWKARTVRACAARGRKLLRTRLVSRGVDVGAALAAVALGMDAPAIVPSVSLTPGIGIVDSLAVSALAAHGLALTRRSVGLSTAVAAGVAVVAVGIGYGLVISPGSTPAGGGGGPGEVSVVPPEPARPKLPFDPVAVYERAVDGCAFIVSEANGVTFEGTRTLIDRENRLVLTTCRVVGDSDVVSVQFPFHNLDGTVETDRKEYTRSATSKLTPMGRDIRRDQARDLALVQLDRLSRDARPVDLAEAIGRDAVVHIGSRTGKVFPVTVRTVRSIDVPATGNDDPVATRRIALSGTTDDMGGMLVDGTSRLVGIVAGASTDPAGRNITFALGVAEVRAFLAEKERPAPPPEPIVKKSSPPIPDEFNPPVTPFPDDVGPPADPIPKDFDTEALYKNVLDSCVFTVTPMKGGRTEGSGGLIDKEKRLVLTSFHVVDEAEKIFVQFPHHLKDGTVMTDKKKYIERIPAGQACKGTVLHRHKTRDLAIVSLDKIPATAKAIHLTRKSVGVGATTFNFGDPGAVAQVFRFSQGIRSRFCTDWGQVLPAGSSFQIITRPAALNQPIGRLTRDGVRPPSPRKACRVETRGRSRPGCVQPPAALLARSSSPLPTHPSPERCRKPRTPPTARSARRRSPRCRSPPAGDGRRNGSPPIGRTAGCFHGRMG
jgi:S1-C subfamily serine protease